MVLDAKMGPMGFLQKIIENAGFGVEGSLGLHFQGQCIKPLSPESPFMYSHQSCISG